MYKFAIIGCGRICKKHIDAIKEIKNAGIACVCDVIADRARKASEMAGNVPWYKSYDDMLKKEEVDIISILTPSGMHAEHTIDVVKKFNKHIVCEKPIALKLEDADEMIKTCDEYNVRLFVIKQNRYNIPVQKARQAFEEGKFGNIFLGTVRVRWSRDQKYYDQDFWRGTWALDGGVISNQAAHHIDLLMWFMGEPVSVMAMNGTYLVDIECDDTCAALIRFKNGGIGIVEATTAVRPRDLEGSLSLFGEKGSVVIGGFAVNKLLTWNFTGESDKERDDILSRHSENPANVYGFGHQRYLEHVIQCIEKNTKALVDGLEGRKSLELINAIYESTETGREISLRFQPKVSKLGRQKA